VGLFSLLLQSAARFAPQSISNREGEALRFSFYSWQSRAWVAVRIKGLGALGIFAVQINLTATEGRAQWL
jgi:hypothetical protein